MRRPDDAPNPPRLRAVPGGRDPDQTNSDEDAPDDDAARALKVAQARIKILNGYYGRSDIQTRLVERLVEALRS